VGIESALLALGASAGTATTAGSIIGGLSTGLSVLQGVSSLVGGVQARSEAKQQSAIALSDAAARGAEAERVAAREARFESEDVADTVRRQKLAYMASGVTLEGSPLLVMERTRQKGADNVAEILAGGKSAAQAATAEGRLMAQRAKSTGRSAFIEGITGAASAFKPLLKPV